MRVLGLCAKWLGKSSLASGEAARWHDPQAKAKALRAVRAAIQMLHGLELKLERADER